MLDWPVEQPVMPTGVSGHGFSVIIQENVTSDDLQNVKDMLRK
jgi:hypothetical protein